MCAASGSIGRRALRDVGSSFKLAPKTIQRKDTKDTKKIHWAYFASFVSFVVEIRDHAQEAL